MSSKILLVFEYIISGIKLDDEYDNQELDGHFE